MWHLRASFSLMCVTLNVKLIHGVKAAHFALHKKLVLQSISWIVTWISINAVKGKKKKKMSVNYDKILFWAILVTFRWSFLTFDRLFSHAQIEEECKWDESIILFGTKWNIKPCQRVLLDRAISPMNASGSRPNVREAMQWLVSWGAHTGD